MYKIYKLKNKINGKIYIGQTKQTLAKRWKQGEGYLHCPKIKNAINKYGSNNFEYEILCECEEDEVDFLEKKFIAKYDSVNKGYNCELGGTKNKIVSEETRKKLSKKFKGRILSEEHKRRIGLANKGRKLSRETIEKIRQANLGRVPWNTGMKLSDEHKNKLSEAHKGQKSGMAGKHRSLETKIKCSRPVLQFDLKGNFVAEYYGTVEAEKYTGIDNSNIVRCCRGKRRKAGGFIWKYKE